MARFAERASTGEAESKMSLSNRFRSANGDPRYLRGLGVEPFFPENFGSVVDLAVSLENGASLLD